MNEYFKAIQFTGKDIIISLTPHTENQLIGWFFCNNNDYLYGTGIYKNLLLADTLWIDENLPLDQIPYYIQKCFDALTAKIILKMPRNKILKRMKFAIPDYKTIQYLHDSLNVFKQNMSMVCEEPVLSILYDNYFKSRIYIQNKNKIGITTIESMEIEEPSPIGANFLPMIFIKNLK